MENDPDTSNLVSHLINSFETPDETTYILNITPGIEFHDPAYGTYTAHDTQFTYRRAGGSAEYLAWIAESVEAAGEAGER